MQTEGAAAVDRATPPSLLSIACQILPIDEALRLRKGLKVAFHSPDVCRRAKARYSQAVVGTTTHPTDSGIGSRSSDATLTRTRDMKTSHIAWPRSAFARRVTVFARVKSWAIPKSAHHAVLPCRRLCGSRR